MLNKPARNGAAIEINTMEWLPYILGVLATLGIAKLLEMAYKARQDRAATKAALDTNNAGKAIDADVNAFNLITKRLEIVEQRLDVVQSHLMDQKVENAKLEAENIRLSKDNERQEVEINRQRERLHKLAEDIQIRDGQILSLNQSLADSTKAINALRTELHETTKELNKVKKRMEGEVAA